MTTSQDLLDSGIAVQDPDLPNSIDINVTHIIVKAAVDAGLLEAYASDLQRFDRRATNWSPTIKDDSGNLIANPVSAIQAVIAFYKQRLGWEGADVITNLNRAAKLAEARDLTAAQIAALT